MNKFKQLDIVALIFISIFVASCKNDLDVSIFEPLREEVITTHVEKDTMFSQTYDNIRFLVDSVYKTPESKAKFRHLTYSRFYDLDQELRRQREKLKSNPSTIKSWNEKYNKDLAKFVQDSINYQIYMIENQYSNFLELELLKVFEARSWIGTNVSAEILLKPKNGHSIRKISGYVVVIPKDEDEKEFEDSESFNYPSAFFLYSGYTKRNVKEVATQSSLSQIESLNPFLNIPINIIKQKHKIKFEVNELIIDDRYIDVELENIPIEMKMLLRNKDEMYRTYYIRSKINKNYISLNWFIDNVAKSKVEEDFKEELAFITKESKMH